MLDTYVPNTINGSGKVRTAKIDSGSSITMGAGASSRTEVTIPTGYGDLVALGVEISVLASGTLTGAKTLEKAVQQLSIKDKSGRSIFSQIRGEDLVYFDRYFNGGRSRTVATVSGTAQTHRFLVPLNIDKEDMPARLQLTVSAYSDMATSGATGGTFSYEIVGYYQDDSKTNYTQRITRLTQSIGSGINRFAPQLPEQVIIHDLLFTVGTESNITDITFSSNGSAERMNLRLGDLQAVEDSRLISGHVTGQFALMNSPFVRTPNTILDINGAGSDTLQWYVVWSDSLGKK